MVCLNLDWPHFKFSPVARGFLTGQHKSRGRRGEDWEVSVRGSKSRTRVDKLFLAESLEKPGKCLHLHSQSM